VKRKYKLLLVIGIVIILAAVPIEVSAAIDFDNIEYNEGNTAIDNWEFDYYPTSSDWIPEQYDYYKRDTSYYRSSPSSLYMRKSNDWVKMRQDIDSDTINEIKNMPGYSKYVSFSFWFRSSNDENGLAVLEVYYSGSWHKSEIQKQNGQFATANPYDASHWTPGADGQWVEAVTKAYVPDTTTAMRVYVYVDDKQGSRYTTTRIDDATLSITEYDYESGTYGTADLEIRAFKLMDHGSYKEALVGMAVGASSKPGYYVDRIYLTVYLYPYDIRTYQSGGDADVKEFHQSNDLDMVVYPAGVESSDDSFGAQVGAFALKRAAAFVVGGMVSTIPGVGLALGVIVGAEMSLIMDIMTESESGRDGHASGGSDYSIMASWNYNPGAAWWPGNPAVTLAEAGYYLSWEWNEGSETVGLYIRGTVYWSQKYYNPYYPLVSYVQVGSTTVSDYVYANGIDTR
jgi:hypothetical protein